MAALNNKVDACVWFSIVEAIEWYKRTSKQDYNIFEVSFNHGSHGGLTYSILDLIGDRITTNLYATRKG